MDVGSELERRITHVENETVHIYDLIEERAAEVRRRFDSVDQRLDETTLTLGEHSQTLSEHGDALAEILRRLPARN